MRALGKRLVRHRHDQVLLAYNVGSFVGFSKLPPWEQIERKLAPREPPRQMTDDEIMRVMDLHVVGMRAQGMRPAA